MSNVMKEHLVLISASQHSSAASIICLTEQIPLSVVHVSGDVSLLHLNVQQPSVERPGAELQLTPLDVEGKPSHIHVTRAGKYPWRC